ncbi:hypothetical protein ACOSQ4_022541 [Xanthoceras sorbifolium]
MRPLARRRCLLAASSSLSPLPPRPRCLLVPTASSHRVCHRCTSHRCLTCPLLLPLLTVATEWCPAPGCDYAVDFDVGSGNFDVTCHCSHSFCWNCTEEAHRPVDFDTVAK